MLVAVTGIVAFWAFSESVFLFLIIPYFVYVEAELSHFDWCIWLLKDKYKSDKNRKE